MVTEINWMESKLFSKENNLNCTHGVSLVLGSLLHPYYPAFRSDPCAILGRCQLRQGRVPSSSKFLRP